MLSEAFDNVQNRKMKSESGFRVAMASQLFRFNLRWRHLLACFFAFLDRLTLNVFLLTLNMPSFLIFADAPHTVQVSKFSGCCPQIANQRQKLPFYIQFSLHMNLSCIFAFANKTLLQNQLCCDFQIFGAGVKK